MTTAQDIIYRARVTLQDMVEIRWSDLELLGWLSDGLLELARLRPESSAQYGTFICEEGPRQDLTRADSGVDHALALLDVVRNLSPESSQRAVIQGDQMVLATQRRLWPADVSTYDIEQWVIDGRAPTSFLVYPGAIAGTELEVLYSATPQPVSALSDSVPMGDQYRGQLIDYVLYRAYQKDAEYTRNPQASMSAYQTFMAGTQAIYPSEQAVVDAASGPAQSSARSRASA